MDLIQHLLYFFMHRLETNTLPNYRIGTFLNQGTPSAIFAQIKRRNK
jgi:hypothetical protein